MIIVTLRFTNGPKMLCKNANKSSNSHADVHFAPLAFKKIYHVFLKLVWSSIGVSSSGCHLQVFKVLRSGLIGLQTKVWAWWCGSWKFWNFPPLDFVGIFKRQLKNFLLRLTLHVVCLAYFKLLIAKVYQLSLKMHLTPSTLTLLSSCRLFCCSTSSLSSNSCCSLFLVNSISLMARSYFSLHSPPVTSAHSLSSPFLPPNCYFNFHIKYFQKTKKWLWEKKKKKVKHWYTCCK